MRYKKKVGEVSGDKSSSGNRKRRWLRYSLRTFLLLVTVGGIAFGWWANRAQQQRRAVQWVKEMRGSVIYDFEHTALRGEDPVSPVPAWLCDLIGIDFFAGVHTVVLVDKDVSDLTPLSGMVSLHDLYLDGTPISDVTPLSGLRRLQTLCLDETSVSDLTPLSRLRSLQHLDLSGTSVSDLTALSGLGNLQYVDLSNTSVSDLTPLSGLPHLNLIDLKDTEVFDLSPLSEMATVTIWLGEDQKVMVPNAFESQVHRP